MYVCCISSCILTNSHGLVCKIFYTQAPCSSIPAPFLLWLLFLLTLSSLELCSMPVSKVGSALSLSASITEHQVIISWTPTLFFKYDVIFPTPKQSERWEPQHPRLHFRQHFMQHPREIFFMKALQLQDKYVWLASIKLYLFKNVNFLACVFADLVNY